MQEYGTLVGFLKTRKEEVSKCMVIPELFVEIVL